MSNLHKMCEPVRVTIGQDLPFDPRYSNTTSKLLHVQYKSHEITIHWHCMGNWSTPDGSSVIGELLLDDDQTILRTLLGSEYDAFADEARFL